MKFHVMNALTAVAGLVMVSTLGEPLLTDAVRLPLQVVVVVFLLVTTFLERLLRPKKGVTPGALVRNVMGATLIKMMLVMTGILIYVVLYSKPAWYWPVKAFRRTVQGLGLSHCIYSKRWACLASWKRLVTIVR